MATSFIKIQHSIVLGVNMGTDIVSYAELRDDHGQWHKLTGENGYPEFFYLGAERNYKLYEILSGTIDPETGLTSRGFELIAPRRGRRPGTPGSQDPVDGASWLLLQELIDFPWHE